MRFNPEPRWVCAMGVLGLWALSPDAYGQTVKVHTTTIGKYQQRLRIDQSVDAIRSISQRVNLWVWDARGDQSQDLNITFSMRYFTDFGLAQQLRLDPLFGTAWNDLVLERMVVEWRPLTWSSLGLGRQWGLNALGMHEFDGLSIRLRPRLGQGVFARLEAEGGRDLQLETGWFTSDAYDVQGLPSLDRDEPFSQQAWVSGGTAGIGWEQANVAISYRRRDYVQDEEWRTGESRIGAAMTGQVRRGLNISAQGIYNAVLEDVERASVQVASQTWRGGPLLSTAVETQTPWFDSGSIFNVFGARPHRGAWLAAIQNVPGLETEFEGRAWGRVYGDEKSEVLGDGTALGGAIGHRTRLTVFELPVEWRSLFSYQTTLDETGGDQVLGDSTLRLPVIKDVFVYGRGVVLYAETSSIRYTPGWATIGVMGLDWKTELGKVALVVEGQQSTFQGGNLQGYLTWEVEVWP